ncbi:MAG TPA: TetR/AcrR family transcriptional regulator [Candidatus Saccharimonadales bacterium]|nr:TetR/AcrR family transcriptional regulator [Candidatus Saccharimonadales bacterium]
MRSDKLSRTQVARRKDIVEAAIRVINTRGYTAASIMTIAKEAATSKSTVLYHFSSKEKLITAIVGSAYADGAAYMKPRIDAEVTMSGKLQAYIASNLEYLAQHTAQIAAVHQIMLNTPATAYGNESIDRLEKLFQLGQAAGEFGEFDARNMAVSLRQVIDGSSFYILQHPDIDIDAYITSISQMFKRATKVIKGV